MTSARPTSGSGSEACASSVSPTATRGASGRCCWTRTAAPFSCSRNRENTSSIRTTSHGDAVFRIPWEDSSKEDWMTRQTMLWPLGVAVGFLALIGVGASVAHYVQEPYNPGFLEYPIIVAVHVVLGGLYLTLVPFQFVRRIRSRHLRYHRRVGRILVSIGLVVGVTALFMGLVIPFFGWGERVIIGLFGTVFLVALTTGFLHVRAGRVALHREWMMRAFAVGLSIATQRLIFFPALWIVRVDELRVRVGAPYTRAAVTEWRA